MGNNYSFMDLNAQYGGTATVFQQLGFDIVGLYEYNKNAREFATQINPKLTINELPDVNNIPYSDVLFADISKTFSVASKLYQINNCAAEVIMKNWPSIFVLKTSMINLKNQKNSILPTAILRRYAIHYQVFKESEYSGFPVKGNQTYIIGINNQFNSSKYYFPQPLYRDRSFKNIYEYLEPSPNYWYRKLPMRVVYNGQLLSRRFYQSDIRGNLRETDLISTYMMNPTYICDNQGLRKFTHNEYAMLKGYSLPIFNNCKNKYETYRYIASLSNLYIIEALAKSIYDFLGNPLEATQSDNEVDVIPNESHPKADKPNPNKQIYFSKNRITNITIDNLKGLSNLSIDINKNLVAIMGVNGVGKSTVLHALACSFSPFTEGAHNYKFSFFFTPNTDALWDGSKLSVDYYDENTQTGNTRYYEKKSNRWWPRYSDRPKKNVYYLGISTGIPEIEKEKQTTFINYSTIIEDEKNSTKILKDAASILNKDYKHLTINKTKKKTFVGVCTEQQLKYTSLSMGAGEQRLFKILDLVYNVPTYSLVLIDEIDLLLHVNAQKRLVSVLHEIADKRNLQIIFTTHSLDIANMSSLIDIRYLYQTNGKTMVYNQITPDMIFDIKHEIEKPLQIYVEDDLAKTIIMKIAASLEISKYVSIKEIGAAGNIFVMAAAGVLDGKDMHNQLFVLDGDVKSTPDEKRNEIKHHLTGTETTHNDKIDAALSVITQLTLPKGLSPEKYLHNMILNYAQNGKNSEISICAQDVKAVSDSHEWIDAIISFLDVPRDIGLYRIIDEIADRAVEWEDYIKTVREWLINRKQELNLKTC